ncbi:IS982 family transposase [Enterococcus sp. DIV1420a]|uniref:IS982 family transposase n=1 Tax=Enterococcus sp. DIV1420a TaxID=2774672 RepID=UPI003F687193
MIISAIIWACMLGFTDQMNQYKAIKLFQDQFPERSRYSCICANLKDVIKMIRCGYVQELHQNCPFSVIDSMPIPLCATIRNRRAKLFTGTADIGFNATKQLFYYGLKLSVSVNHKGFPTGYVVPSASIHDINVAPELVDQAPTPQVLSDKGYVSQELKRYFSERGIDFWTPRKSNSKQPKVVNEYLLKRLRKRIETVFSSFYILLGKVKNRSLAGFESKLEVVLLTYSFMLELVQRFEVNSLRYSLGQF